MRHNSKLTNLEKTAVQRFADMFISCSLNPHTVHDDPCRGQKIVDIIKEVNCHNCTSKCQSFGGKCRYAFPRYPLKDTLVIDKNEEKEDSNSSEQKNDTYRKILNDVEDILNDPEMIEFIMNQYDKGNTKEEYYENRSKRIDLLLQVAGNISYDDYVAAIKHSKKLGCTILLQRDVDEIMVNNYNPEWTLSWNANHDIQPVLCYFSVITYVTDYWAKSDEGVTQQLIEAAANLKSETNKKKRCQELANIFLTHRQMGVCFFAWVTSCFQSLQVI